MSIDSEKLTNFKRLYVASHQLYRQFEAALAEGNEDEHTIAEFVHLVDRMISMLPLEFPGLVQEYFTHLLVINLEDAEDWPDIPMGQPENIRMLDEGSVRTELVRLKLLIWTLAVEKSVNPAIREKYIPYLKDSQQQIT